MQPIVTVTSFNDAYAELAAVSITSLVHNTERDCDVHIFESSLSEGATAKVLSIQDKYPNARITVHHIPDEAFADVADGRYGKETWYPLLAPEILGGLDRALVIEPDMLVCRDLSELYDMDMGDSPLACYGWSSAPNPQNFIWLGKPLYFNIGPMLLNLRAIREGDAFRMGGLADTVRGLMLRCAKGHHQICANETYLNHILDHGTLTRLQFKYNAFQSFRFLLMVSLGTDFDEICEAISNPAIAHYLGAYKPNSRLTDSSLPMLRKWWDYHALSPFADAGRDAERLEEIMEHRKKLRSSLNSHADYCNCLLFDDLSEAVDKLKRFKAKGTQIVFYGAGSWGTLFAAIARSMGLVPDKICDLNRHGAALGGVPIEPPDALKSCGADAVVALAIADPQSLTDARGKLPALGIPESRVLPVFEPLSLGGRRMGEILGSMSAP